MCSHLRELSLSHISASVVKETAIWKELGATLEVLSLGYQAPFADEIEKVEIHCRKLRNIQIYQR